MTKLSGWVSLLCLGLAFSRSACAGLEELQYLTEEYKPFNYTLPSGQAGGIAVELLQRIWLRTGTPAQTIRFLPWARGYQKALTEPNSGSDVGDIITNEPSRLELAMRQSPFVVGANVMSSE